MRQTDQRNPEVPKPTTVREAFFEVARRLNLTTIFGNPGTTEETLLKDFPDDFRYVLALQEASAVGMADGYAQATGKAVLVSVHTAAGLGNAMGNIESAWYNHAPLIIVAGNQTREMLLLEPFLANTEPTMVPRPFVKWSYEIARAQDAMAVQPPAGTGHPYRHNPSGGKRGATCPCGGNARRRDLTGFDYRWYRR